MQVDVVVLGAGGGGYPAAFRLARSGRQVVMVDEKGNLGGNCLYEGCVPSKSVRQASVVWQQARHGEFFGLQTAGVNAPWSGIRSYKDGVQRRRYAQHAKEIQATSHLTLIRGRGYFLDPNHVTIDNWDTGVSTTLKTQDVIIATGSEATPLPIPGFDQCWNQHDLFAWNDTVPDLPGDVVILGGGYIGVESASMLEDLGVRVTLIEMEPTILSTMDAELVEIVSASLKRRINLITGVVVDRIEEHTGSFTVIGHRVVDNGPMTWTTSRVLAAVGRQPAIPKALGLDTIGLAYTRHGIAVDSRMRTNVPHIYAAGDVNGLSMLFHSAVRMSEIVAQTILSGEQPTDYFRAEEMPTTVFARPELFSVGLTRQAAERRGLSVIEMTRPMGEEAWAQITGELEGQLKFVMHRGTGEIVGIHGVGVSSVELSAAAHMAVRLELTAKALGEMTFPHPTQFEALDRLARSV